MPSYANAPCTSLAAGVNVSMGAFGLMTAGEFSNAVNDCDLYLNNVGACTRYERTYHGGGTRVGSCTQWNNYQTYDSVMRTSICQFALSSMDALQVCRGIFRAPLVANLCSPRLLVWQSNPWTPPLRSWQTGGLVLAYPLLSCPLCLATYNH
jgi:glucan 1,3-beta-glucosidase